MHNQGDESARDARPRLSIVAVLALAIALGAITVARGAAAVPGACAAISVARENARAGATGWEPPVTTALPSVQGYANTTSAVCGQRVTLYLGTHSTRPILVRIVAWRLGYYRGTGGRRVWTSAVVRVLRPKTWEAVAPGTNTVTAPWRPSVSFTIPHTWTQGVYELRLVPLGGGRHPGAIPLVVRDATHTTKLVEVLSTNTWQMYNTWGGFDAYSMPRTSRIV